MHIDCEFLKLAKRLNNHKRGYLLINEKQGKHLPVAPSIAFEIFSDLSEILIQEYKYEKLLLIGFAETATAIGTHVAIMLDCQYIQTTREYIPGANYLYFSEEHSHATEQKLIRDELDSIIDQVDRIIFIEDEITTGKTIRNIISVIQEKYNSRINFSVASIVNGMNQEDQNKYDLLGIKTHYLVKTDNKRYEKVVENIRDDGLIIKNQNDQNLMEVTSIKCNGYLNARRLVNAANYQMACEYLWNSCKDTLNIEGINNILVLGTEEFMYPALYIGNRLEQNGKNVKTHSTTRSPIVASRMKGYPISARYEIISLYDDNRKTFLYNLEKYDMICVVTDAINDSNKGICSLVNVLEKYTDKIIVVRWAENEKFL